jgi:hypothetical protein
MFSLGPTYQDTLFGRLRRLGSALARDSRPIDRVAGPLRRPVDRAWYVRALKLRDLQALGASVARTPRPEGGTRVLVLSLRMWNYHTAVESIIGQALRLRGADVTMVTCGGGQPICEIGWGRRISPRPCDRCAYVTDRLVHSGEFSHARLSDEFPWGSSPGKAPAQLGQAQGMSPAEAARASVTWFLKSTDTERPKNGPAVERDFAVSAAAVDAAFGRILDRFDPDVVLAVNGLFAAERAVCAAAAERGVRVVTYEVSPRKDSLVFGEGSPAPEMNMDGLAEDQMSQPLSNEQAGALDALLAARESGASAHESYFGESQDHRGDAVRSSLGIEPGKRVLSAFTNLAWDSALFGNDVAYASQFEWLARLCELAPRLADTAIAIRVHPAESRWGTGQPVESELHDRIGELPENVRLIRPDDSTSSYGLLAISDLALCYTTTVGLEAAVRGVPVAVAARTHYRGRGFTVDIDSDEDLVRVIADPPAMSPNQVELARRYAFAFFFRRMVPFRHVRNDAGRISGIPHSAEDLLPGQDPYLDFVCDRILGGGEFFLPASLALESPRTNPIADRLGATRNRG